MSKIAILIIALTIGMAAITGFLFLRVNTPQSISTGSSSSTISSTTASIELTSGTMSSTSEQETATSVSIETVTLSTTNTQTLSSSNTTTVTSVSSFTTRSSVVSTVTTTLSETSKVPSEVTVYGSVVTTGEGTYPSQIIFRNSKTESIVPLTSGSYEVTLPNLNNYSVSIYWRGQYAWQSGIADRYLSLNQTTQLLEEDWMVLTPNSNVSVFGGIFTSGEGTQASTIHFSSQTETYSANLTNGQYQISLPNEAAYNVSANWRGKYLWQNASTSLGELTLDSNGSSNIEKSWQIPTPNSEVIVSGSVLTTGAGTLPKTMYFGGSFGTSSATTIVNGRYSIEIPNDQSYNVSINWSGAYSWQAGNISAGQFFLDTAAGTNSTNRNWDAQTPNSMITVSGSVRTSGSGTIVSQISFASNYSNFSATLDGGQYTVDLPNLVDYILTIGWKGAYPWQNGSATYGLAVFGGAGASSLSANYLVPTPNSTITVSGNITCASGTPVQIDFLSSNGFIDANASVVNGEYSLLLPNYASYTVVVSVEDSGLLSRRNAGVFELNATPGTSSLEVNWIC